MQLLIVRHAIAQEREAFAQTGKPDSLRPLTTKGRAKMKQAAKGLHRLVPNVDLIASSPFERALATAEIVGSRYSGAPVETTETLRPDAQFGTFVRWLVSRAGKETVGVVGHEPHLSGLATWLICGTERPCVSLGKGGACLIEFPTWPQRAKGTLLWLQTPKGLRRFAR